MQVKRTSARPAVAASLGARAMAAVSRVACCIRPERMTWAKVLASPELSKSRAAASDESLALREEGEVGSGDALALTGDVGPPATAPPPGEEPRRTNPALCVTQVRRTSRAVWNTRVSSCKPRANSTASRSARGKEGAHKKTVR